MSTYRTRMSVFSCLIVFLTVLLVGGTALAATTVVVKPSDLNGWLLTAEVPPQLTGSGSFVSGPPTPPFGNGSVQFTVDATGSYLLATTAFNNTRLADITRDVPNARVERRRAQVQFVCLSFNAGELGLHLREHRLLVEVTGD